MTSIGLGLVAVPPADETWIRPDRAPSGTTAVIRTSESTVKAADSLPNVTSLTPAKFAPEMVTIAPRRLEFGEKDRTSGRGWVRKINSVTSVARRAAANNARYTRERARFVV